ASAVGEVGDDGGNAAGGGALCGVDHDEQFDDRGVHRGSEGLDQVDIAHADVLLVLHEDVFVRKLEDIDLAEGPADTCADGLGKLRVSPAGKNGEVAIHVLVPRGGFGWLARATGDERPTKVAKEGTRHEA